MSDDTCPKHPGVAMIRDREHIGDGKTQLGKPYCPLCADLGRAVPMPEAEAKAAPAAASAPKRPGPGDA